MIVNSQPRKSRPGCHRCALARAYKGYPGRGHPHRLIAVPAPYRAAQEWHFSLNPAGKLKIRRRAGTTLASRAHCWKKCHLNGVGLREVAPVPSKLELGDNIPVPLAGLMIGPPKPCKPIGALIPATPASRKRIWGTSKSPGIARSVRQTRLIARET